MWFANTTVQRQGERLLSISDHDEVASIARDVQDYLEAHPHAADTLDGVVKWWLARQRYDHAKEQVLKALELLEREGVITIASTADQKIIYSRVRSGIDKGKGH